LLDIATTVQKKESWQVCPPTANCQWLNYNTENSEKNPWLSMIWQRRNSLQKQTKSRKKSFWFVGHCNHCTEKKNLDRFAHLPQIVSDWSTVIFQRQFVSQIFVFTWILYWIANSVMRVNSWKHHRQTRNCQNSEKLVNTPQCKNEIWFWISFDKFILWRLKFRGWQPWPCRTNVPRTKF
jgi:hypothetical protein